LAISHDDGRCSECGARGAFGMCPTRAVGADAAAGGGRRAARRSHVAGPRHARARHRRASAQPGQPAASGAGRPPVGDTAPRPTQRHGAVGGVVALGGPYSSRQTTPVSAYARLLTGMTTVPQGGTRATDDVCARSVQPHGRALLCQRRGRPASHAGPPCRARWRALHRQPVDDAEPAQR